MLRSKKTLKRSYLAILAALVLLFSVSAMAGAVPMYFPENTDINFIPFKLGTLGTISLPETWRVIDSLDDATDHVYIFEDYSVGSLFRSIAIEYLPGTNLDILKIAQKLRDDIDSDAQYYISNYRLEKPVYMECNGKDVATVSFWYYIEYIEEFYIYTFVETKDGVYMVSFEDTTPQVKGYLSVYDKVIDSLLNQIGADNKAITKAVAGLNFYE